MNFDNSIGLRESRKKQNPKAPIERFNIAYVIKKGYFNLVRYLLNIGADPNVRDRDKNCSKRFGLIYCTFIDDEKWALNIAQNLLECGAYLKNKDENGLSALHYCAAFGLAKLLKLFMESLDFDLTNELDNDGNSVLHYAFKSQNVSCINILLEKCQQSHMNGLEKMTNKNGYTALEFISNYSYKNISTPLASQNDFFERVSNSADNKSKKQNISKLESKSTFFQTELDLDDNFRSELNESGISHSQSTIGDENRYFFVNSYEIAKTASTTLLKECHINNNERKIRKNSSDKKKLMIEKNLRTLKLIRYNPTFFKKEHLFKDLKFSNDTFLEDIQKKIIPISESTNTAIIFNTELEPTGTVDWKSKITFMFTDLENSLTSSLRLASEKKSSIKSKKTNRKKRNIPKKSL